MGRISLMMGDDSRELVEIISMRLWKCRDLPFGVVSRSHVRKPSEIGTERVKREWEAEKKSPRGKDRGRGDGVGEAGSETLHQPIERRGYRSIGGGGGGEAE